MTGNEFLRHSVKIAAIIGALFLLLSAISPYTLFYQSAEEPSVVMRILAPAFGAIFSVASILVFGGFFGAILLSLFGLVSLLGGLTMLIENPQGGVVAIAMGLVLLAGAKKFTATLLNRIKTLFPEQYPRFFVVLSTFPILSTFYFWYLVKARSA